MAKDYSVCIEVFDNFRGFCCWDRDSIVLLDLSCAPPEPAHFFLVGRWTNAGSSGMYGLVDHACDYASAGRRGGGADVGLDQISRSNSRSTSGGGRIGARILRAKVGSVDVT